MARLRSLFDLKVKMLKDQLSYVVVLRKHHSGLQLSGQVRVTEPNFYTDNSILVQVWLQLT